MSFLPVREGGSILGIDLETLAHRGPDGVGHDHVFLDWGTVSLGQTRLAIVGGEDVPVPYRYEHLDVVLVFNGEVYNWRDLQAELPRAETACDAEIVALAYRKWGADFFRHLNGMFALALVDLRDQTVLVARDRAGEKPLFWCADPNRSISFASEVQALGAVLEPRTDRQPTEIEALEYDCLERTPFEGVFRVPPASFAVLSSDLHALGPQLSAPTFRRWWALPTRDPVEWPDQSYWADELLHVLWDAIRIRASVERRQLATLGGVRLAAAGRPVTACVSGGLDSAIIQAVARLPQVYAVTLDGPEDVLEEARVAAMGAEVVPVRFGLAEIERDFVDVARHLGSPATWSAFGHWYMAEAMRRDGYTVTMTGEGADEIARGYSRYRALWWLMRAYQDEGLVGYEKTVELAQGGGAVEVLARLLNRGGAATEEEARKIVRRFSGLSPPGDGGRGTDPSASALMMNAEQGTGNAECRTGDGGRRTDLVRAMAHVDWHTTMQCLLRMADRMYMAHGIESRSPYFDYRVVELAEQIPTRVQISEQGSKLVLRAVARRLGVDRRIVDARTKRGLVVPWNRWRAVPNSATRGAWDRGDFAMAMTAAWKRAFRLC